MADANYRVFTYVDGSPRLMISSDMFRRVTGGRAHHIGLKDGELWLGSLRADGKPQERDYEEVALPDTAVKELLQRELLEAPVEGREGDIYLNKRYNRMYGQMMYQPFMVLKQFDERTLVVPSVNNPRMTSTFDLVWCVRDRKDYKWCTALTTSVPTASLKAQIDRLPPGNVHATRHAFVRAVTLDQQMIDGAERELRDMRSARRIDVDRVPGE